MKLPLCFATLSLAVPCLIGAAQARTTNPLNAVVSNPAQQACAVPNGTGGLYNNCNAVVNVRIPLYTDSAGIKTVNVGIWWPADVYERTRCRGGVMLEDSSSVVTDYIKGGPWNQNQTKTLTVAVGTGQSLYLDCDMAPTATIHMINHSS